MHRSLRATDPFERCDQRIALSAQPAGIPPGQQTAIRRVEIAIGDLRNTDGDERVAGQHPQTGQLSIDRTVWNSELGFDLHR